MDNLVFYVNPREVDYFWVNGMFYNDYSERLNKSIFSTSALESFGYIKVPSHLIFLWFPDSYRLLVEHFGELSND